MDGTMVDDENREPPRRYVGKQEGVRHIIFRKNVLRMVHVVPEFLGERIGQPNEAAHLVRF
jgi:hypothetical protein